MQPVVAGLSAQYSSTVWSATQAKHLAFQALQQEWLVGLGRLQRHPLRPDEPPQSPVKPGLLSNQRAVPSAISLHPIGTMPQLVFSEVVSLRPRVLAARSHSAVVSSVCNPDDSHVPELTRCISAQQFASVNVVESPFVTIKLGGQLL